VECSIQFLNEIEPQVNSQLKEKIAQQRKSIEKILALTKRLSADEIRKYVGDTMKHLGLTDDKSREFIEWAVKEEVRISEIENETEAQEAKLKLKEKFQKFLRESTNSKTDIEPYF
jgi:hypothetical protein